MKYFIFFSIIFTSLIYPQQNPSNQSLLKLQADLTNSADQSVLDFNQSFSPTFKSEKKSVGLAMLYSLLLPGMGELYAGSYSSGKYFTIAEGLLWGTYLGMNTYANWQKDRYISFAQSNAGISTSGKDEEYYAIISDYLNIEEFNDDMAKQRRFDEMLSSETHFWKWADQTERRNYRGMWVSSEQTFNDLRFVVGILIVNRIASVINAVRSVAAYNKRQSEELGWNVSLGLIKNPDHSSGLSINFVTGF